MITTHLLTLKGLKAKLADPWQIVYPQCGHLSTIDRAQVSESLPAKERHPKFLTTEPHCQQQSFLNALISRFMQL